MRADAFAGTLLSSGLGAVMPGGQHRTRSAHTENAEMERFQSPPTARIRVLIDQHPFETQLIIDVDDSDVTEPWSGGLIKEQPGRTSIVDITPRTSRAIMLDGPLAGTVSIVTLRAHRASGTPFR